MPAESVQRVRLAALARFAARCSRAGCRGSAPRSTAVISTPVLRRPAPAPLVLARDVDRVTAWRALVRLGRLKRAWVADREMGLMDSRRHAWGQLDTWLRPNCRVVRKSARLLRCL